MPTMNIAAITPNSATNAGSSMDCDRAAENGSLQNSGNSWLPRRRDARAQAARR